MNKKQCAGIVIPIIVIVVCAASVVSINRLFIKEEKGKSEVVGEQSDLYGEGYIEIITDVSPC